VSKLLRALDVPHRLAAALALGAGCTEKELLGLRAGDFSLRKQSVRVRGGRTRGRPGRKTLRYQPVAAWAWALVLDEAPCVRGKRRQRYLFPRRGAPDRPRIDLNRGIRRGCLDAFGDGECSITLGALRRLWQQLMRDAGMPRVEIRQSYSLIDHPKGFRPLWFARQQSLLSSWVELGVPPVDLDAGARIARTPPKTSGPYDRE